MLRDSIQSSNKYFKVLYGPLDHIFYITLHNRPYKYFVLYDECYRQVKKIDVTNVSCFQSKCVNSESTYEFRNRKKTVLTTKHVLEIYFGSTNRNPLVFTTLSFDESKLLSTEIENVFGVRVYTYGSLNTAFRKALKQSYEKEDPIEDHNYDDSMHKYKLQKHAHEMKNLYDLAQIEPEEQNEPLAEFSGKYPVVIEGDMESGSFVSYRDIKTKHGLSNSVYKVEWYLSTAFGSPDQFFQIPSETSDTFYLSEYMIGHYVMVKVYRALKYSENRSFVFSVSQKGPICPNTQLCHNILINSSRRSDFHDVLISTLDLDVLFAVVDKSSKFGAYKPFNNPNVVKNYPQFQKAVTFTEDNILVNEQDSDDNKVENPKHSHSAEVVNVEKNEDPVDLNSEEKVEKVESDAINELEDESYINNISDDLFEDENDKSKIPRGNYIKLKVPSREIKMEDNGCGDDVEDNQVQMSPENMRNNKESLKFLYGMSSSQFDKSNESTTVSDLSEDEKKLSYVNEYNEKPKKKRFSVFNLFKSNKALYNPKKPNDKHPKQIEAKQKVPDQRQIINKKAGKVMPNQKKVQDQSKLDKKVYKENQGIEKCDKREDKPVENQPNGNIEDFEVESGDSKMFIKQFDDTGHGSDDKIPMNTKPKPKWSLKLFNKLNGKDKIHDSMSVSSRSTKSTDNKHGKNNNKKPKKVIYDRKREKQMRALREKAQMNDLRTSDSEISTSGSEELEESVSTSDLNKRPKPELKPSKAQKPVKTQPKQIKSQKNNPVKGGKLAKGQKSPDKSRFSGSKTQMPYSVPTNLSKSKPVKPRDKTPGKNIPTDRAPANRNNKRHTETKKGKGGIFGMFKKKNQKELHPDHQNKQPDPKELEMISFQKYKRIVDTIKFVPVKLRICLNEMIITFGLTSLSLRWNHITVEKADQLCFGQFPSIPQQLENQLTVVYNNGDPIKVRLRTQSPFQRNVLFHSIIFNKFRRNYSIDRCDRELNSCFYDGIRRAYVRVCAAYYESSKRNEEKNQN